MNKPVFEEHNDPNDVMHSHSFVKDAKDVVPKVPVSAMDEIDRMLSKDKRDRVSSYKAFSSSAVVQKNIRNPHLRAKPSDIGGSGGMGGAVAPGGAPAVGRTYNPYA